jgi:uncharacterized protein (TIGR01777 family)
VQVVLAGASGLIGTALAESLTADGHRVTRLVRGSAGGRPGSSQWDPAAGRVDEKVVAAADAVVCLSGAGVGDRRWNADYKREIHDSRVDSVATLARAIAEAGRPPVFLAASAVGYYGDTGDREVDEDSPAGSGFLADVCRDWEAAADPARAAGVRVVHLRTGLVLARQSALLQRLRLVVKAGLGGRLGSGRQYMPWISLADEVRAIRFLLDADVGGPVNLTAPTPLPNRDFTKALGEALHRPTPWAVPGFAVRIALGEFAGEVLTGQRAVPRRLLDAGFRFEQPRLDDTLAAELG